MKLYMLTLAGQGDVHIKFIEKETWDWMWAVESNIDAPMPEDVLKAYQTQIGVDNDGELPNITRGSAVNDAALQCPVAVYGVKDEATFFDMKDALDFITAHNVEVIDTFEGCIY